ncbi:pyrroline-5-carboxylate reductase [Acidiphilium acidophilum]|uniref:Pyrroline-5-carboxylate reductase n=1 Tax=Acidiphilium acidophilum TaxID=76588 RepID=A0AAW9DTS6_ACIAO|nr:pyrroline-5-carboxylate reductase [Acidiphilium acidophilum]MDX5932410.1 pyrroline-5-carboxylate reductase [Acidiphilium acidophilum]GBQ18852.1 pyrroline-5-carboxylate reductase [Acidiphilium acidophilum DSM 700]
MTATLPPLLLIGGGKMGAAMLAGWRERGISQVVVIDPGPDAAALAADNITVIPSIAALDPGFAPRAVILAVKPQVAPDVIPGLARFAGTALFVSIMAGKTIAFLAGHLGPAAAIVRAMPNTPAAIRQGITVACAARTVTPDQHALAQTLLGAVGAVEFVTAESLLDAVTAVSGGGPAYVFLLTELLETAAIEQGIPPDLARRLARQTVIGSASLLAAGDDPPATLRRAVTSPKGTTERALAVLMDHDAWPAAMSRAIEAATARSRELGETG